MSNEHPIENLMKSTMENIRNMVDVNTIVGDPVETNDGSYIIPVSKVSFGFASGGSDIPTTSSSINKISTENYPFGGGSGAGVTIKPVGFLIVRNDSVRMLPVESNNTYDKIIDTVPQVLDMIKELLGKYYNKKDSSIDSTNTSCHLKDN